jgi:hypothetical protein
VGTHPKGWVPGRWAFFSNLLADLANTSNGPRGQEVTMPDAGKAKARRAEMDWETVARELAQTFGLSQKQVVFETRKALIARVAEGVAMNALQGKMVSEEDKAEFRTEVQKAINRLGVYWSGQWPGQGR